MDIEGKDLIKQEMIKMNKGMHGSKKIVYALCSVNVQSTFSNTYNMENCFFVYFSLVWRILYMKCFVVVSAVSTPGKQVSNFF